MHEFKRQSFWLLSLLCIASSIICVTQSLAGEAYYAYDDLGRLTTVVDEAGNTAIYNYDAVGNLVGIDRFTPGGRNEKWCQE